MKSRTLCTVMLFLLAVLMPLEANAQLQNRYVTLRYGSKQILHDFNDALILGRKLKYYVNRKNVVTVEEEVLAKLEVIVEKAEVVLDMFPANLHFTIVLLPTRKDVANVFMKKYGKKVNHIAYYSLREKTIYISVANTRLRVIAHEIGHVIVDHYFKV